MLGLQAKFIEITGMVKRPGLYEILPGENLSDLLEFSLGFAGGANTNKITLDKVDFDNTSIIKILQIILRP